MRINFQAFLAFSLAGSVDFAATGFTRDDGCRRIPTRLGLSSDLPLLPETVAKRSKRRKANPSAISRNFVQTDEKDEAVETIQYNSALPNDIPRLSDLLSGATKADFSRDRPKEVRSLKDSSSANKNRIRNTPMNPWRASFKASIRTQGRIKKAFEFTSTKGSPDQRAIAVLNALLSTSPDHCNAANVICALTYSAKAMGQTHSKPNPQLQALLFQTLDILHELVNDELLTARQLSNAAWAIAKHYDRDDSLLPAPAKKAAMSSDNVLGVAEAWSLEETSVLEAQQKKVDEIVDMIAMQLTSLMEETDERSQDPKFQPKVGEICMTSWSFGILRPRHRPPGWQAPPQLGRLPGFNRSFSERVSRDEDVVVFEQWGAFNENAAVEGNFSESCDVTDRLFDAIAGSLSRSCDEDFADADKYDDSSIQMDRSWYRTNVQTCTWSELANVGWAFASHGSCRSAQAEMLLLGLAREACRRLSAGGEATRGLQTRDVAQLVWSLGTLQADNFRLANDLVYLVEALSQYLRLGGKSASFSRGRPLRRWSCPDLVQVAISLAHARIDELPLLRAVYQESTYRLVEGIQTQANGYGERKSLLAWEVSVLLWALARLNLSSAQGTEFDDFAIEAPKFIMKAYDQFGKSLKSIGINSQEQANIAWSLTVLENHQSDDAVRLFRLIFREAAESCKEQGVIQLEHAHQLWQAYFLLEDESPEAVGGVPTWFRDYLEDKWSVEKAREKMSSARHRSLSQALTFMGVEHYNEHDEDIDVAIVLKKSAAWTHETNMEDSQEKGFSVAVEFDGPNHFTREKEPMGDQRPAPPRALGHTVLKYRLLKKQGWSVVRVPYYEFDKIPFWASMVRIQPLLLLRMNEIEWVKV